jgi:hypothetical protein
MSRVRRETLGGSQSGGGNMASVMSKPSIWTVGGTAGRREKERGHILIHDRLVFFSPCSVCVWEWSGWERTQSL